MKVSKTIVCGCLTVCFALLNSQTLGAYMEIRIDAGANPSPAAGWNVVSGGAANMGVPVSLIDATGATTDVTATLASIQRWNNTGSGNLIGNYAGTVLADGTGYGLFIQQPSDPVPWWGTLTLDGLELESWQWYRIEMSASGAPSQWNKTQDAQVNGEWADGDHTGQGFKADTHGYDSGIILSWDNVRPDANGLITLTITRAGSAGTHDAYLNALIISLLPEPSTGLLMTLGCLSFALRRRRRRKI
ncbi:MAG: PEP-CTERM sorting domain-containing protein [Patescibacteria group bacterium]|nr:PEP-CTERM sorting domain-containing protein [Patescibacteria group bacterium]